VPSLGQRFARALHAELSPTNSAPPTASHRRVYTPTEKSDAVEDALRDGIEHTAAARGIPLTTLRGFVSQAERSASGRTAVASKLPIPAAAAGVAGDYSVVCVIDRFIEDDCVWLLFRAIGYIDRRVSSIARRD
jgi:hypothetical protein